MKRSRTGVGLLVAAITCIAGSGSAFADPTHQGATLFAQGCKSCHVVTRESTGQERAVDGRTVLYQKIKERSDSDLQKYLTDPTAKRPADCQVVTLSVYQAPLLLAFLRAASRPEQPVAVPIVKRAVRERPPGVPGGQTRRAGTSRGGSQ